MNFKAIISVVMAIIIGAFIISKNDRADLPNVHAMEYSDYNDQMPEAYDGADSWNEQVEREVNSSFLSSNAKVASYPSSDTKSTSSVGSSNEEIVFKPIMDLQRGIPSLYYPLPSSWKVKNDGWYGPHGVEVKQLVSGQVDIQQQRYQSPEQLIANGDIGKEIRKGGGKISDIKRINSIAQADQNYCMLNSLSNSIRTQNEAIGFTIHTKGKKSYGILKTTLYTHQFGGGWNCTLIGMDADATYIDKANEHLIYAYSNFKPNMQQVAMYKADEQRKQSKSNKSWSDHNARMRNNQRNFEARNKAIVDAGNATNNAIMSSYRSSSESFDRMSQMTTNGTYNENTVTNPYDGTSHQVDNNYDRTFMNAHGDQIQTNDQFYEPGMDPYANGYEEVYPNGGY